MSVKIAFAGQTRKLPAAPLLEVLATARDRFGVPPGVHLALQTAEGAPVADDAALAAAVAAGAKLVLVPAAAAPDIAYPAVPPLLPARADPADGPRSEMAPATPVTEEELAAAMEDELARAAPADDCMDVEEQRSVPGSFPVGDAEEPAQAAAAPAAANQRTPPEPILPLLRSLIATLRAHWDSDPELQALVRRVVSAVGANAADVVRSVAGMGVGAWQATTQGARAQAPQPQAQANGGIDELADRIGKSVEEWAADLDRRRGAAPAAAPPTTPTTPTITPPAPGTAANVGASALSMAFVVAQQVARVIGDMAARTRRPPPPPGPEPPAMPGAFPPPPPHFPPFPPPPHQFPPPPPGMRGWPGPPPPHFPPPPAAAFPPSPATVLLAAQVAQIREMGLGQGRSDEELARMVGSGGVQGAVAELLG